MSNSYLCTSRDVSSLQTETHDKSVLRYKTNITLRQHGLGSEQSTESKGITSICRLTNKYAFKMEKVKLFSSQYLQLDN